MNPTHPMNDVAVSTAEHLAAQNDRVAFFLALLAMGAFAVIVFRYLVAQNARLVEALSSSHETYGAELKEITRGMQSCVDANTHQLVRNSEVLEAAKTAISTATPLRPR